LSFGGSIGTALIQAQTGNVWNDVAVVSPDSNNVYWVSYPACLIGPVPPFRGCIVNLPADTGCDQHVARASASGAVAPIRVRFKLTPRTREYRVYRRADAGPLTLVAQGAGDYDQTKQNKILEVRDDGMPPSLTRLCYFVQVLDEHGNGSPLSFIGCKEVKPAKLPRPVLSEPQGIGTNTNPQVVLNWFCPTSGIARFEFKLHLVDAPKPASVPYDPNTPNFASPKTTRVSGYDSSATYLGLETRDVYAETAFTEAHRTARIGPGFGPGPKFTITANVQANATYAITVAAVDDQGNAGDASDVWEFKWTPAVQLPTVPWPQRPLPPVRDFTVPGPGVAAALLKDANLLLDRRYPVGIRIGQMNQDSDEMGISYNVGGNNEAGYNVYSSSLNPDPNTQVFRRKSSGEFLLPIVVYRQQVTNDLFQKVSGDVTQVTPLIERVPWKVFNVSNYRTVVIPDRLFAIGYDVTMENYFKPLWLRDQQPVVLGAKYRYFVVRFNAKREPAEVIPAGDVEIPLNP